MLLQAYKLKDSPKDKEVTDANSISLVFDLEEATSPTSMSLNVRIRIGNKTYRTNFVDVKLEEEPEQKEN